MRAVKKTTNNQTSHSSFPPEEQLNAYANQRSRLLILGMIVMIVLLSIAAGYVLFTSSY